MASREAEPTVTLVPLQKAEIQFLINRFLRKDLITCKHIHLLRLTKHPHIHTYKYIYKHTYTNYASVRACVCVMVMITVMMIEK